MYCGYEKLFFVLAESTIVKRDSAHVGIVRDSDMTQVNHATTQEIENPNEESESDMEEPIEKSSILGKRQSKKPGIWGIMCASS